MRHLVFLCLLCLFSADRGLGNGQVLDAGCAVYDTLLEPSSLLPRWTSTRQGNRTAYRVSLSFLGEQGNWRHGPANRYLAALSLAAEKLKGETNGAFQCRLIVEPDESIRIEMSGDPQQTKKMEAVIETMEPPEKESSGIVMLPFNRLRFTQGTVGSDKVDEKRTTENPPVPAYRLKNTKTGKTIIAVLDGHHRSFSYLDAEKPNYNTLVPIKIMTAQEVSDYFNKKSGPGSPRWPTALIDIAVEDHLIPKGTIPIIEDDFDPTDRRR